MRCGDCAHFLPLSPKWAGVTGSGHCEWGHPEIPQLPVHGWALGATQECLQRVKGRAKAGAARAPAVFPVIRLG